MEAIIKTDDKKNFRKIMDYLKSLGGVSVMEKQSENIHQVNYSQLLKKLSSGYKLGAFNSES